MKVAIPTNGERGLDEEVSNIFGRAPFFTIVDLDSMSVVAKRNPGSLAQHAAGVASARAILNSGTSAVITREIGPNSYEILREAGVKVFSGVGTVKDVVERLKRGELEEFKEHTRGFGHDLGRGRGFGRGFGRGGRGRWM